MPFPTEREIELPLLKVLADLGGSSPPRTLYGEVAKHFPNLSEDELKERLPNTPTHIKWWNLVQWTRQRLVQLGEIDGFSRGAKLAEGNAHLREGLSTLREHAQLREKMTYFDNAYWTNKGDGQRAGPFCPKWLDGDGKAVRMEVRQDDHCWRCHVCQRAIVRPDVAPRAAVRRRLGGRGGY
jgi:hypothetical protein